MQPPHDRINSIENELYQSYDLNDKIKALNKLYYLAAFQLLITIISAASSFYLNATTSKLEFLLLAITNLLIIANCLLDLYWGQKYPPLLTQPPEDEDYYQSLLQSSQQISYIHSLLSQISLALEIALFFCLIHFNSFASQAWISILQVLIIMFLGYMVFIGYIYTHNIIGTKRFIIYVCAIIVLIISAFSSIILKQCLMEIHLQVYMIDPALINCIKVILLLVVIFLLLIGTANNRRMKPFFAPLAFIFLILLIIQTIINGTFIRQIQGQQQILDTSTGCRFTMEVIGQKSLEKIGWHFLIQTKKGCKEKYLNQEYSPFLPCPKAEQSYMWEQDLHKLPNNKLNTLACLNTSCCPTISKNVLYYPKSFTILSTLLVAIGFVLACNLLALTKQQFKVFQIRVYGEIAVIILIAIIIAGLALLAYNYEPTQPEQVQPQLVQMNDVKDLKRPSYKKFTGQSPINVDYNLENCQLAVSIMLEHIQLNGDTSSLKEPGVRVAISGTNGVFATLGNINSESLWYMTSSEIIEKVFPNDKQSQDVKVDYVIFQGGVSLVDYFVNNGLFFCTDDPLNANFNVVQEYIDLKQLSPEYSNEVRRNLLQRQTRSHHEDSEEATQGSELVNKFGNLQLNNLKFFQTKITVRDLEQFTPIADADVYLYFGGYLLSSCQVITKMQPHMLYGKTDAYGVVKFHNLDQGYLFTVMISAKSKKLIKYLLTDYKHGCALVDLTALTNQQLHYKIYLTNEFASHSMRLVLQWEDDTDYDLYGVYDDKNVQCLTGPLSRACGGMEHKQSRGIEWLSINKLEPFEYLFFVTRYLSHEDALKKISQKGSVQVNQDLMNSKLKLAIYVNELDYPLVEYPMPIFKKSEYNAIEVVWLAFCVNGKEGDSPKGLQKYWSKISPEDVMQKNTTGHPTWPSVSVCHGK